MHPTSTRTRSTRNIGFACRTAVALGVKPMNLKASGPVNVTATIMYGYGVVFLCWLRVATRGGAGMVERIGNEGIGAGRLCANRQRREKKWMRSED
jgi:hypothetical protein